MRERNDSRYEQFEISHETIEQELRHVDCEQRQTDLRTNIIYIDLFYPAVCKDKVETGNNFIKI